MYIGEQGPEWFVPHEQCWVIGAKSALDGLRRVCEAAERLVLTNPNPFPRLRLWRWWP